MCDHADVFCMHATAGTAFASSLVSSSKHCTCLAQSGELVDGHQSVERTCRQKTKTDRKQATPCVWQPASDLCSTCSCRMDGCSAGRCLLLKWYSCQLCRTDAPQGIPRVRRPRKLPAKLAKAEAAAELRRHLFAAAGRPAAATSRNGSGGALVPRADPVSTAAEPPAAPASSMKHGTWDTGVTRLWFKKEVHASPLC